MFTFNQTKFRCESTPASFSATFPKEDNFCDTFLFPWANNSFEAKDRSTLKETNVVPEE